MCPFITAGAPCPLEWFEGQRDAEESNEKAEIWVKHNLGELLLLPEFAAGESSFTRGGVSFPQSQY